MAKLSAKDFTDEEIDSMQIEEIESLLTDKMKLFAKEYIIDFSALRSALASGYSKKTAVQKGYELKNHIAVKKYIELLQEKRERRLNISQDKVVREAAKVAFFNIKDLYDDKGNQLPIHELPPHVSAGISKIKEKLIKKNSKSEQVLEREIHFHDKLKSLDLLGKHLGIYEKDNEQRQPEVHSYMPDNKRDKKK